MDMKRHMLIYVFVFIQSWATRLEPLKREVGAKSRNRQTSFVLLYTGIKRYLFLVHMVKVVS
jgi:hypothetical protein